MKIRTRLVSNSSSSSFIVLLPPKKFQLEYAWFDIKDKMYAACSPEEIEFLLGLGFHYSNARQPSTVEFGCPHRVEDPERAVSLAYSIICNESEVIQDLVEKDIPFLAIVHYGCTSIFRKRGEGLVCIDNPGLFREMYLIDDPIDSLGNVAKVVSIEEVLKNEIPF